MLAFPKSPAARADLSLHFLLVLKVVSRALCEQCIDGCVVRRVWMTVQKTRMR